MAEQQLEQLRRQVKDLQAVNEEISVFRELAERANEGIGLVSREGVVLYANAACRQLFGFEMLEDFVGMDLFTLAKEDDDQIAGALEQALRGQPWRGELIQCRENGTKFPTQLSVFGIYGEETAGFEVAGFLVQDLSTRRAVEQARLQEEVIAIHRRTIRELSTPVIPVTGEILVIPLIGAIDTERARTITEVVLKEVTRTRAQILIIDITGVSVVDTAVASALMRMAQAVRLLGSEIVLVGITPAVAQTIIQLGVDLHELMTQADLQSGVEYALRTLGRAIVSIEDRERE